MSSAQQIEIALDLLDFSEGIITTKQAANFWKAREYQYNVTAEDKNAVFLTAYSLQNNGQRKFK